MTEEKDWRLQKQRETIRSLRARNLALMIAAKALLNDLDNITTEEFSRGDERKTREALRAVIAECKEEAV